MVWVLVVYLFSANEPKAVAVQRVGEFSTRAACEEKRRAYMEMLDASPSPGGFDYKAKCVEREALPTS